MKFESLYCGGEKSRTNLLWNIYICAKRHEKTTKHNFFEFPFHLKLRFGFVNLSIKSLSRLFYSWAALLSALYLKQLIIHLSYLSQTQKWKLIDYNNLDWKIFSFFSLRHREFLLFLNSVIAYGCSKLQFPNFSVLTRAWRLGWNFQIKHEHKSRLMIKYFLVFGVLSGHWNIILHPCFSVPEFFYREKSKVLMFRPLAYVQGSSEAFENRGGIERQRYLCCWHSWHWSLAFIPSLLAIGYHKF